MERDALLGAVARYYEQRLQEHGPTAKGVDWNSGESQTLRFAQLLRALQPTESFTLNDFGCGYGELAAFLQRSGFTADYVGFDVSPTMVGAATAYTRDVPRCRFTATLAEVPPADYTVASGLFNVKLAAPRPEWEEYVWETISTFDRLSTRAFAFNVLTSHADADRMRDDLYYADPADMLDRCLRTLSRHSSVLHDYELYEFTVVVRKPAA